MKLFATLSLVLLFTAAYALPAASGNFTISLTETKGTGAYLEGAADTGRAPATFLQGRTLGNLIYVPLTPGSEGRVVVLNVGVGEIAKSFPLRLDTGSPVTWFKYYVKTSTGRKTDQLIHLKYGTAPTGPFFLGYQYKDRVTLGHGLQVFIDNQPIGVDIGSPGFDVLGVLGLGPVGLTQGMLYPDNQALIPTVMDNLFAQGKIEKQIFSVYLQPSKRGTAEGSVIFGGIDSSFYVGDLTYVSVTRMYPSSTYWGIEISCTYGDQDITASTTPGIIDTGSQMILLADEYFAIYMRSVNGWYDWKTRLMVVSQKSYRRMKPLHFNIGGRVFTLDADAQLIPPEYNVAWGGRSRRHYSWINRMGVNRGEGLDFVLGLPFLRRLYTVYDTTNRQIGFAEAVTLSGKVPVGPKGPESAAAPI